MTTLKRIVGTLYAIDVKLFAIKYKGQFYRIEKDLNSQVWNQIISNPLEDHQKELSSMLKDFILSISKCEVEPITLDDWDFTGYFFPYCVEG